MPRFYFDVLDHLVMIDDTGSELPGLAEAELEAVRLAGEILRHADIAFLALLDSWRLQVRDDAGGVVAELRVDVRGGAYRAVKRDNVYDGLLVRCKALIEEGRETIRLSRLARQKLRPRPVAFIP